MRNKPDTEPHPILIQAEGLSKVYRRGSETVAALHGVTFEIRRGEFVAITGPSGSGKTTLLNLLGAMDVPTAGTLILDGFDVASLTESGRTQLRRHRVGFVFQHFGLVPTLTVEENVALPAFFARRNDARQVSELLETVGLGHRRNYYPSELSGGEMQRAAIARALVNRPPLWPADEPTGNLDMQTGLTVLGLFRRLNADGLTVLVVTHNDVIASAANRRLDLRDGRLMGPDTGPTSMPRVPAGPG